MLCSSWFVCCSSSGGDIGLNVFTSLVHACTHIKKKKYLLYEVRRRNEEVHYNTRLTIVDYNTFLRKAA
jgi:hypothetical protein